MQKDLAIIIIIAACVASSCGSRASAQAVRQAERPEMPRARTSLEALPAAVRPKIRAAIEASPDRFFELLAAAEAESSRAGDLLVLVDKHHPLPSGFVPPDLVSLNDYALSVSRKDLRLRKAIIGAVEELNAAAAKDGVTLVFSSSYRSFEYQDGLFTRYAAQHGEAEASRFSARPGMSQHQLGTAIDFGSIDDSFAQTAAGLWMAANAHRYGFSLSYPRGMEPITGYVWESWHYRYITKPAALLERDYFGGIQQYLIEFISAYRAAP